MARRRRSGVNQSLDSLLDTMANVVGILILVLLASMIHFGDAVERVREGIGGKPSPEQMWQTEQAVESGRARLEELEREWRGLAERARDAELALAGGRVPASQLEERAAVLEGLEADLAAARGELARVSVVLEETRATKPQRDRIVRLPDPRPPPDGALEILYFCRYGRIIPVNRDDIFAALERGWRDAVGAEPWELDLAFRDHDVVVDHFARHYVGRQPLRWRVELGGPRSLEARLTWSDREAGELASELRRPESAFRRHLSRLDRRYQWVRFYVWGDSYDVYLEARRIADEAGFAAGWRPFVTDVDPVVGPELQRPEAVD